MDWRNGKWRLKYYLIGEQGTMGVRRKMTVLPGGAGVTGWSNPAIIPAVPLHLRGLSFI